MNTDSGMIYSPDNGKPIGQAVILPNGSHGITFKWGNGESAVRETVPLDKLHELVVKNSKS